MACFSPPVECFAGHKSAVVDITAFGHDSSTIATSSHDGTIRLWDLRSGKTRQCFTGFGEDVVNMIKYAPYDSNQIFGMTETSILNFDLRHEGLIVRDVHSVLFSLSPDEENQTELSTFAVHPLESLHVLAVGDDEGTITMLNSLSGEVVRTLHNAHSNVVGAVVFQPKSQSHLCSGGFDSRFCCWDFCRGKSSGSVLDFSRDQVQQQQMANPPFVHDMLYHSDGKEIIAALGDGSLRLMTYVPKRGFECVEREIGAHGGMTTHICEYHSQIDEKVPSDGDANNVPHLVMSAGIDCFIRGWKIQRTAEVVSQTAQRSTGTNNKKKTNKKKQGKSSAQEITVISTPSNDKKYSIENLFEINHKDKVNAMISVDCSSIAVADVTSMWKLYKLRE